MIAETAGSAGTDLIPALHAIVGDKGLVLDEAGKRPYVTDWRGTSSGQTAAVVRPVSTSEVSRIVRLCGERRIAIVPQGGNTGLVGGGISTDADRSVVLSLGRMNRIIDIDPLGHCMTVEAGCILQTMQEAAAAKDLLFPLSLGAEGSCTIGGNIATNAGGVQVLRYGNARQLVLGLEVVLPDGNVWNGLRSLKKDNAGYDLKHLFIGSEGTLGIITKAVVKLWPLPKQSATAWIAIRDPQAAIELLADAIAFSGDAVSSCELMSRAAIDMVVRHVEGTADPLPAETSWSLLLEWSSSMPTEESGESLADRLTRFLVGQFDNGRVLDAVLAQNEAQTASLWKVREGVGEAARADGPGLTFDVSVPTASIPRLIERGIEAVLAILPSIRPYPLGHIGDGNLHFSFKWPRGMPPSEVEQFSGRVKTAVYELVTLLSGSISAEHGIGSEKILDLRRHKSSTELATMQTIKRAMDPNGIMNPGKMFSPDPEILV
ncbi:FAD-binding oxidoreductase [Sphingomonas sp. LB2R24]